MDNFKPPEIYELGDPDRLAQRRELLGSIESNVLAKDARGVDWGALREKGYEAMTRPEGRDAFNLDREPEKVRDRYGRHPLGQNLLLARRMVEAGVRFVTVNGWTGRHRTIRRAHPAAAGICTAETWAWATPLVTAPTAWDSACRAWTRRFPGCSPTSKNAA